MFLLLASSLAPVFARTLFFGKTHAGKTTMINAACDLDLPVASDGQFESTTKTVDIYSCLGSEVMDSIGFGDFVDQKDGSRKQFGVKEILTLLLESAESPGLSSIVWVWPTSATVGDHDLMDAFEKLRELMPGLPMAIVQNEFPAMSSGVPQYLADRYKLPLIRANLNDPKALQQWIRDNSAVRRFKLPKDWRDSLDNLDLSTLREQLTRLTLLACDKFQEKLDVIMRQIEATSVPEKMCEKQSCIADCTRERRYCRRRVLGVCVSRRTESWIDQSCQDGVNKCQVEATLRHQECEVAHNGVTESIAKQVATLKEAWDQMNDQSADIMRSCEGFKPHVHREL